MASPSGNGEAASSPITLPASPGIARLGLRKPTSSHVSGPSFSEIDEDIPWSTSIIRGRVRGSRDPHWPPAAQPRRAGLRAMHSIVRTRHPSASINIHTGRYRDFANDSSLSLFDVHAIRAGCGDWKASRAFYAEKVGVDLPASLTNHGTEPSQRRQPSTRKQHHPPVDHKRVTSDDGMCLADSGSPPANADLQANAASAAIREHENERQRQRIALLREECRPESEIPIAPSP